MTRDSGVLANFQQPLGAMDVSYRRATRELEAISSDLGLSCEEQDWGIVNADSIRVSEFINYYERRVDLSKTQRFEMGELVLASANEAFLNDNYGCENMLLRFVEQHRTDFFAHLQYWMGLEKCPDFPLSEWLTSKCANLESNCQPSAAGPGGGGRCKTRVC